MNNFCHSERKAFAKCHSSRLNPIIAMIAIVAPALFAASAVAAGNQDLAKPLIFDGIKAYERGDYSTAVADLAKAQSIDPSHSPTALYLGLAYLKEGRLPNAIDAWQKYIALTPYTRTERRNNLQETVTRDLTILQREQDHRQALADLAREHEIGSGSPDTVAVTYYRNLGSPNLAPLQKGLTALVIADLSEIPGLRIVERDRLQALLDEMKLSSSGLVDPATATRAGHLLGAGRVVTGSYLDPVADDMRVDSALASTASGQVIADQNAQGPLTHFYDVEKRLSNAIAKDLGYGKNRLEADGVWPKFQTPQTTNFQAFEAFSRGLDAKDRQDYAAARSFFQQALADDPNFEAARRELLHTPLAPLTVAEVANAISAAAPSAAESVAGMAGPANIGTGVAPMPFGGVPPPPELPAAPPAIHVHLPLPGAIAHVPPAR
jgi:tetratricopeptide (TPR) repeat protein